MIAGMIVLLAFVVVKSHWALRESGMLGSCAVFAPMSDGGELEKCTSGRLDGLPDLTGKGCTAQTIAGSVEFWSCPAPIGSAPAGI